MTAATVTPAEIIRDAHAVLHLAMERPDRGALAHEVIALADVLDAYAELDDGTWSWELVFPELSGEADPGGEALRKVAEKIEAAAEALVKAVAGRCGTTPGGDAGTEDGMKNAGVGQ